MSDEPTEISPEAPLFELNAASTKSSASPNGKSISIRRDVILLVVGALIGVVPSLIISWMNAGYETHRLLLDRRSAEIKEISRVNSKIGTDVIPKAEALLDHYKTLQTANVPYSGEARDTALKLTAEMCSEANRQAEEWDTEMAILSALYQKNFLSKNIPSIKCNEPDKSDGSSQILITDNAGLQEYYKQRVAAMRDFISSRLKNEEAYREIIKMFIDAIDE